MRKLINIGLIVLGMLLWLWLAFFGVSSDRNNDGAGASNGSAWGLWFGAVAVVALLFVGGVTGPLAFILMGIVAAFLLALAAGQIWRSTGDDLMIGALPLYADLASGDTWAGDAPSFGEFQP